VLAVELHVSAIVCWRAQ